ncbi:hypothetical protein HI914_01236 [Erysiphe necator]|uniref:Putative kinetochore protein n=1 Tax=Uncinula necator TaxID=52586 RepID=A0A0B1P7Y0_UNCNE|nr:hypothetical protein HI914_01236 [Erysiphe necator]KHJ34343.1 putative kinetochore protein [Erysiphe necator]
MDNPAPTLIELKAEFLRQQIHILSEPLRPTADFYATRRFRESPLEKKTIDKALNQLNKRLKRHNNLIYGRRAQRHVAEQVDRLSWDNASQNQYSSGANETWTEIGTDYCASVTIEKLTEEWPIDISDNKIEEKEQDRSRVLGSEAEAGSDDNQNNNLLNQRYTKLRSDLVELNTRRHVVQQRLEKLNSLRDILKFFDNPMDIQSNLVTRGGGLEQELERMCRLMLRVERVLSASGPIHSRIETDIDQNYQMDLDEHEEHKILELLS